MIEIVSPGQGTIDAGSVTPMYSFANTLNKVDCLGSQMVYIFWEYKTIKGKCWNWTARAKGFLLRRVWIYSPSSIRSVVSWKHDHLRCDQLHFTKWGIHMTAMSEDLHTEDWPHKPHPHASPRTLPASELGEIGWEHTHTFVNFRSSRQLSGGACSLAGVKDFGLVFHPTYQS